MKKDKINLLIIVNCILACIFLLISGTFAAYTSLSNAKRTVSTVGSKQLFSSNILVAYDEESGIQNKSLSFSSDVDENTFVVSICNYDQGDKTRCASNDIHYSVSVSLIDLDSNLVTNSGILSKYKWNGTSFSGLSQPITDTLSGGIISENIYRITVPADIMKDYRIKITADSDIDGYSKIGRIISVAEEISAEKWKIQYLNDECNENAYDLGCINIRLMGSEHKKLILRWNPAFVEIDPWFLEDMGISATNNSITFEAGGTKEDGTARQTQYNVTFYRTKAVHADDEQQESWNDIKSYITLESEAISEKGGTDI